MKRRSGIKGEFAQSRILSVTKRLKKMRRMIKWSVLIDGLGLRVVMSKDIDGAYLAAMKEYGCKIEDILAVFCHSPFKPSLMN